MEVEGVLNNRKNEKIYKLNLGYASWYPAMDKGISKVVLVSILVVLIAVAGIASYVLMLQRQV